MSSNVEWKQRFLHLREIQALPLKHKVEKTRKLLSSVLQQHARPAVAWSGGKDSTVLLHMALEQKPDIDVLWLIPV